MAAKIQWVKYRDMGGPRFNGEKKNGSFVHEYDPKKPWGVWSQIVGVVAECEGNFDTVVMYDETGVTAGFLQWTFKSGRLQKLLQYLKGVPIIDFTNDSEDEGNLFDSLLCDKSGTQVFEKFGFEIIDGFFCTGGMKRLHPSKKQQQKKIVDICMGRYAKNPKKYAKELCLLFAELGQDVGFQSAQIEFGKFEFKKALDVKRSPLKSIGGTIRHLFPVEVWGTPIPAIFFNLYQNAPAGAFRLFINAMRDAQKKGVVGHMMSDGFYLNDKQPQNVEQQLDDLLNIIWYRLNRTAYADWGFRSKQYLESNGKNPPRIVRIRSAIEKYYGFRLPFFKKG